MSEALPIPEDPLFSVRGARILVAGAAHGLGAAIARMLAERGARLVLLDRDAAGLAALGLDAPAEACDICDERALEAALDRLGDGYSAAVNAAGILAIAPADELDIEVFRRSVDVNLLGAFLLSRGVARRMHPDGGSILHISSVSSLVANPNYAAYASSKAALSQLVRVLAREWAGRAVRVNAIGPAMTETPMTARHLGDPAFRAQALASIPLGRFGRPDDLFAMVLALIGPGGRFTTGQTVHVDGGRTVA